MIELNGKVYRNLEEQVRKNQNDISDITESNKLGIIVVGHVDTAEQLPSALTYAGHYGDAYTVGTEAPYSIYVFTRAYQGETVPHWFNLGNIMIEGPQGPQGATGPAGQQGTRGSIWTAGGNNPSITSDTIKGDAYLNVNTGDLYIFNGSWWVNSANIKGPTGTTGADGEIGPQGPMGPQGPQGPQGIPSPIANIKGIIASTSQLPSIALSQRNDAYLVGTEGLYDIYIITGTGSNLAWENAGPFDITDQIKVDALDQVLNASYPVIKTNTGTAINFSIDSASWEDKAYLHQVTAFMFNTNNVYRNTEIYVEIINDSPSPITTGAELYAAMVNYIGDVNGARMSVVGCDNKMIASGASTTNVTTSYVFVTYDKNNGNFWRTYYTGTRTDVVLDSDGYLYNIGNASKQPTVSDKVTSMNNILGTLGQVLIYGQQLEDGTYSIVINQGIIS